MPEQPVSWCPPQDSPDPLPFESAGPHQDCSFPSVVGLYRTNLPQLARPTKWNWGAARSKCGTKCIYVA